MRVLHINSSTREKDSQSLSIANHFISAITKHTNIELDTYNLFEDELPKFDGTAVGAKMALFTGQTTTPVQALTWEKIKAVHDRFASADAYVFNVPLWNNNIPYVLKQLIDVVTQPGWSFGFDMEKGYSGLLQGKKAYVIYSSGVYYDGISPNFGSDFATPYLDDWLKFIGINDIHHIHVAPTVVNSDYAKTKREAELKVETLAKTFE